MDVEDAIRTRRTHKAYTSEPVDRATLDELFELARWAPNHNLTNPWRFRVVGPRALAALKAAAGPEAAGKPDRPPAPVPPPPPPPHDQPLAPPEELPAAPGAHVHLLPRAP